MAFTNITDEELVNLGVSGLPDTPELSTEDMQAQFDEYPQFLKDKFKTHIAELEANTAAADIGMKIPTSLSNVSDEKLQPIVDEIAARVQSQQNWQDQAEQNLEVNEINTAAFHADNETVTAPTADTADVSDKVATTEFVNNKMQAIGAGDMAKSVYDPNDRGVVESAYKVGESYVESITESQEDYPVPAQNDKIKVVIGKIIKYLNDIRTKVATQLTDGVMAKEDKIKLDNITKDAQAPDYGSCTTAGSTAAKVITVSNTDFKLKTGVVIGVDFSNVNTAQSPTFNVNNTGAKGVMFKKNVIAGSNISYAGNTANTMLYMYNGTYWVYVGDVDPVYDTALSSTSTNAVQNKKINEVFTDIVNVYGMKNLLPNNATSRVLKGITFTVNDDDSITASGTQDGTGGGTYLHLNDTITGDGRTIRLSGCPSGGSATSYRLYLWDATASQEVASDEGNGAIVTLINGHTYYCNLHIYLSYAISGTLTFKPMITVPFYNGDYVPYAKSNKELTDAFTNQVADSDDAYSPSKAYKVGEHCIYNNVLYKCITACSAAAWSVNQNCFEPTTLTSAVTDLNNETYSKTETDTKLNKKANLSGATFTGQINLTNVTGSSGGIALKDTSNNTRTIRLEANGGGGTAFKMGAPLKSSYGVMEIGSSNDSNGVHTYGSYLSAYNYAGNALVGVNASAFNVGSSRRYKENIQSMTEEEAKKLLDVDVVTFNYKADSGIAIGDDRFNKQGVIAEDVNNICPDVVTNRIIDGKDMIDSVDYSKFVPRLIKMVQIQEMRIKELEAKSL